MKILITGAAGFVGFHTISELIKRGDDIIGLDAINDYYDPELKYGRLAEHGINKDQANSGELVKSSAFGNYQFIKLDLADKESLFHLFKQEKFDAVCNLAAQAGVRYSLTNPDAYMTSNFTGFLNILEGCRHHEIKNLSYASSSSVYGLNETTPFSTHDNVDHPISLYAASKKANELMAHTYSHLYGIHTTGLRFFTVYGPWGRPDMAYFSFTKAILGGKTIDIYNEGDMWRDFTYIDDIVDGIIRVIDNPAKPNLEWDGKQPDTGSSRAPFKIYNIGNSKPVQLMEFISTIESALGKEAEKNYLPMQPGDVYQTYADVSDLQKDLGYQPKTSVKEGIGKFVKWYKEYYH